MADRIKLQVARYRPEQESETTFDEYEVPCPKEWVVLDGLNHVKDRIDGTLAYRWSCRMGVCGSCGMMVNGEPKLTCATFLADYGSGPVRVEPLSNFPVIRDLIVDIGDFMRKLSTVKPWIVREEEKPLSEGEYRQTPQELDDYKQYSMCINCMLCYSACPVYGLDSELYRPRCHRTGPALQPRQPGRGRGGAGGRPFRTRRALGLHLRRGSAPRCVPRTSIPPAPSSATS